MEPNLLSAAFSSAPSPTGTSAGNGLESAPVSAGGGFGSLIRSALKEKGLQEDEKPERSLPVIDSQWICSLLNPVPALLGERTTGDLNRAGLAANEQDGPEPLPGVQDFGSDVKLQAPAGSGENGLFTASSTLAPDSVVSNTLTLSPSSDPIVPGDPARSFDPKGLLSTAVAEVSPERVSPVTDQGSAPDGPAGPDQSLATALSGAESGTGLSLPDLLNPYRALSTDSRASDEPPKTAVSSADRRAETAGGDGLNPLPADRRFESVAANLTPSGQSGIDLIRNRGVRDPVHNPRPQDVPFPERTDAATRTEGPLPDAGEGQAAAAPEDLSPLPNGRPADVIRRTEGPATGAEVTEKATVEKAPLSSLTQKESGQGLESFSLSGAPGHPSPAISTNADGTKELSSSLRAEPPEIHDQVGRQILFCLRNNEEKIRLLLEPPELGSIYMEVKRDKELVKATVWTDNSAAKEVLESHQVQLQKLLKADGFALEKFDVFVQQGTGWFQDRKEKPLEQEPWSPGEPHQEGNSRDSAEVAAAPTSFRSRESRYVDVFI